MDSVNNSTRSSGQVPRSTVRSGDYVPATRVTLGGGSASALRGGALGQRTAVGGARSGCPMMAMGGGANDAVAGAATPRTGQAELLQRIADTVRAIAQSVMQLVKALGGKVDPKLEASLGGGPTSSVNAIGGGTANLDSPVQQVGQVGGGGGVQGIGAKPLDADNRTSAIPSLAPGSSSSLKVATGQVSYRQVEVSGPASFTVPAAGSGLDVQTYALRDYDKGAQHTQVLEPLSGNVTIPAGHSMKVLVRMQGTAPGQTQLDIAGAKLTVDVSSTRVTPLPMMAWLNEGEATRRGVSASAMAKVLGNFGVSATGNSGLAVAGSNVPVQYYSVAYDAAHKTSVAAAAQRIAKAEASARAANPNAEFWVQVSDEQDHSASEVAGTASWIGQLRAQLASMGSHAKLFVAAQAKPENMAYARVVDGWATTQSAAGRSRDSSIAQIQAAGVKLLEYPGNAFFDAGTAGGAAVSTATAALDGARAWFLYSANNQSTLEQGGGVEGKGDIGGLVVVDGGRVLPTISLVEAELGASLGSAARITGANQTSGATQVASIGDQLDAYRHTGAMPALALWEAQIGSLLR
jgi:hypothetical protein